MSDETFRRLFLKVTLKNNRIEIREGMWPMRKRKSIMYSNISSVDLERGTKRVVINTNDGKQEKLAFGGTGRKGTKCREAILDRL